MKGQGNKKELSGNDQSDSEFIREFIIAKRELEHIKKIIKEKFGIEIKAKINQ